MEKSGEKSVKQKISEKLNNAKNKLIKNSLKLFYNDEDRGKNCFEHLSKLNKKICTDMGQGELIDEPSGLIAGRHTFWDSKTYTEHCISEFRKKCEVDFCVSSELASEEQISTTTDEL